MPRIVEEELVGYGWGLLVGERQALGEDGQPLFNGGAGGPRMEPIWVFVFQQDTPGKRHIVKVTFDEGDKQKLVEALTGGIAVVGADSMPKGPPAI